MLNLVERETANHISTKPIDVKHFWPIIPANCFELRIKLPALLGYITESWCLHLFPSLHHAVGLNRFVANPSPIRAISNIAL